MVLLMLLLLPPPLTPYSVLRHRAGQTLTRAHSRPRLRVTRALTLGLSLTLSLSLTLMLASSAIAAPARDKTAKKHAGVRAMFDAATQLYDTGKYPEALAAYQSLLRKYPDHEPALIQTAKTLYRLDRYKDSYAYFAKINLAALDPETSYEYGWTYFTTKSYEGSLKAFQRVPKGHSLYDLANYYGGLAAIKLRRLDEADEMLERAVVLPDKLAKSRALYLKHVQALRLMHDRDGLAQDRDRERAALTAIPPPPPPPPPARRPYASQVALDGPYDHLGYKTVERAAIAAYSIADETIASSANNLAGYTAKVGSFDFITGQLIALPWKSGKETAKEAANEPAKDAAAKDLAKDQLRDRQGAVGLQLDLGAEDRTVTGTEQTLWSDVTPQDLARQFNQNLGNTNERSGKLDTQLWVELPLPANLWVDTGAELYYLYGSFERGRRNGFYRGYADLHAKFLSANLGVGASYTAILDPTDQPVTQIGGAYLEANTELLPKMTLSGRASYDSFTYANNGLTLDGPDSILGGQLALQQLFPLGLKLRLAGAYQEESNYIFHGVPSYTTVNADGAAISGKASLELSPWPWITLGMAELITSTAWSQHDPGTTDAFNQVIPNYVEDFTAWASLNLYF